MSTASASTTANDKIRSAALAARRAMPANDRAAASREICDELIGSHEFNAARKIACYLPMRDEVDPRRIIARAWRANKRVFCPVVTHSRKMLFCELQPDSVLERGPYGIWEPVNGTTTAPRDLDIVVTPLVAFDEQRHRIGMGGGYYDRCFAHLLQRRNWLQPKLIGVAYNCQKVEKIQPNPWDIRLYSVISR